MASIPTGTESVFSAESDTDGGRVPMRLPPWRARQAAGEAPILTVDGRLIRNLALRAMASGGAGLVKVGVASVQHGDGATTIARSLAVCLAENFGQRVLLVEANQRSPCLRALCGLPVGPGLSEVLTGAASLESALRMARSAGRMLILPASPAPAAQTASQPVAAFRDLVAELFFYADALVFDLPPLLPYPDAGHIGRVLDGLAVVMRAGTSTRQDCALAVQGLQGSGVPVLGAVLNRERRFLPRFLTR